MSRLQMLPENNIQYLLCFVPLLFIGLYLVRGNSTIACFPAVNRFHSQVLEPHSYSIRFTGDGLFNGGLAGVLSGTVTLWVAYLLQPELRAFFHRKKKEPFSVNNIEPYYSNLA